MIGQKEGAGQPTTENKKDQASPIMEAAVRALASAVDATGMIYSSRWGDAPLRFLTLSLFATIDDLVCLGGDFHYVHHGHQHKCLNKTALVETLGISSTRVGCVP